MEISSEGLKLIKEFEGLRLHSYRCSANVLTIGYGHTASWITEDSEITEVEAEELLRKDVKRFSDGVTDYVKVPLNQNEFDALVSFAFNLGLGALSSSTLLKLLNDRCDRKIVAAEFQKWCKAGDQVVEGLLRRRKAEAALFLKTAPNSLLANSILAKQDTWLKRKPVQSSALAAEEKLFVPKGSAHVWKQIVMLPGCDHYKVILEAQPDKDWYFFPAHWKIINDALPQEEPAPVKHESKLLLNTPYYSQRDNYRDAMRTCFSSSCAMLVSTLHPGSLSNDDEYLETVFELGDTTDSSVQIRALEIHGVKASLRQDGGWSDIDSQLVKGIPVPIGVLHKGSVKSPSGGGHWLVVVGRTEDNSRYICNDPFGEMDLVSGGYPSTNGKHVIYSKKNLGPRWMVEGPGSGWFIKAEKP